MARMLARDAAATALIQSALDAIVGCDAEGRIVVFNGAAEQLFRYAESDVLGRSMDVLLPEVFRGRHQGWMVAFGDHPQGHRRMRAPGLIHARRADGSLCPIEASISSVDGLGGRLYFAIMRDISDRLALESENAMAHRKLAELHWRSELAMRASGFGVWEWDRTTDRLAWDASLLSCHGVAAEAFEYSVAGWCSRMHPEDRAGFKAHFERWCRGEPRGRFVFRAQRDDDGRMVHVEVTGHPVREGNGEVGRVVGLGRDVSAAVQAEESLHRLNRELDERSEALALALVEAKRANAAKGDFLSNVSHELRTPLHGILGFAGMALEDDALNEAHRRALERIRRNGNTLLVLVNDLLDSSRIDAGTFEVHTAPVDLVVLVRQLGEELEAVLEASAVGLDLSMPESAPFRGDPVRLAQAFRNIVANAIRFSPSGGTIRLVLDAEGDAYRLTISDEGPGVPAHEREAIFEKFVQSSATRKAGGGTGLGLPISRGILRAHGGDVYTEANEPHGARFVIDLPARAPQ